MYIHQSKKRMVIIVIMMFIGLGITQKCPIQGYGGSIFSDQLIAAYQSGIIPINQQQETHCYDYLLPYEFSSNLGVAVSVHDFEAKDSKDLYFYIKPIHKDNILKYTSLSFAIRTQWKYTDWNLISFSFMVQDHQDIQAGYYQIDSGALAGCRENQNIEILLPFRNKFDYGQKIINKVFLHGFEIHTIESHGIYTPYQIQIAQTKTNITGVIVSLSVTSLTQINSVYISFIAFQSISISYELGDYKFDSDFESIPSYTPAEYIPKNFARIYGLTGFILLNNQTKIVYKTEWDGQRFLFTFGTSFQYLKYFSFEFIFFTGSQCSYCPGYPISFQNQCLSHCPSGTFLTDKNICIKCGTGMQWNGTLCVKSCPKGQYLNLKTSKCECPPTLNWNGDLCIPCTNGKIFDEFKKTCMCPKPLRWNGFTCAQIPECYGGKIWDVYTYTCKCPEHLFWDVKTQLCKSIPTCTGGQILDMSYNCVCSSNYYWNGQRCIYTNCYGGQIWNGAQCTCSIGYNFDGKRCVECINGQIWDPTRKQCTCEPGYKWNGNFCDISYECQGNRVWNQQYKICICAQKFYWSGYTCLPLPNCKNGQVWNKDIQRCVCQKNTNWNGKNCQSCQDGSVWDQQKLICVCPPGTIKKGEVCLIIQQCTGGKMWMQHLKSCECPSDTQWNGYFCIANPCQKGRIWSQQYKACKCPDFKIWDGQKCIPPKIACNNGQIWNQNIYACTCPDGLYYVGNQCLKIPSCSNGMHYNPFNRKCSCKTQYNKNRGNYCFNPNCQQGQQWNGFKCLPITCAPLTYYQDGQCRFNGRQKCPDGYKWRGQKCVLQPVNCPDHTEWDNFTCIATEACRQGFYPDYNGQCRPFPQKCIPPTFWDGKLCAVTPHNCPNGTYYKDNSCKPIKQCLSNYFWDTKLFRCSCPEGKIDNGNSCIQCQKGMVYIPNKGCQCPPGSFDSGSKCQLIEDDRCNNVPNSYWKQNKCLCRSGFTKVGYQCICYGVQIGKTCSVCSYKPHSQWINGDCRCKQGYTQINRQCVKNDQFSGNDSPNQCHAGSYFDRQKLMCLACPQGCLTCQNCYTCKICRPGFDYDYKTEKCIQYCGDGKRFILECDDNNNQDGDGCSRDCRVQAGFVCQGGSPNSKDSCIFYQPQKIKLSQTGIIRKSKQIVLNIKANYLPRGLILSDHCQNQCLNILLVEIVSGDISTTSISSRYIPGTQFSFVISIDYDRQYIGRFRCMVRVNPQFKKYFGDVQTQQKLFIDINPAYFAKVQNEEILS